MPRRKHHPSEAWVGVISDTHGLIRPEALVALKGALFLNPGSAGPRRFRLPVSLGRLRVGEHGIRGELLTLVV